MLDYSKKVEYHLVNNSFKMEEKVAVLVYICKCFIKSKCVKSEANPLRDNKVIELLQSVT